MNATREKIVSIALDLFNSRGSAEISTNHIAESAGISPGNLYYHFRNKEEIIRAIFQSMIERWNRLDKFDALRGDIQSILDRRLNTALEFFLEYSFIHRELATLIRNDPELARSNAIIQKKRRREIRELIHHLGKASLLNIPDADTEKCLAETVWMVSLFWQPYLEVTGERLTRKNIARAIQIINALFRPYMG